MSGPKHLWSGDWERESAATSGTETDGRQDQRDPTAGENAATTPAQTTETAAGNERRNGRIAVVATIAVLLIAVIAIAATSGGSDPGSPTSAAAIPTIPSAPNPPTGTGPSQTIPNLTIPSPATPSPTTPGPATPNPATPSATTSSTTTAPTVAPQPVSWLGMEILTIPSGAAVVDAVTAGGAADRAGLTPGDIVVEVDHHGVTGSASIAHAVRGKHKGDKVIVTVVRGGTSLDAQTTFTGPPTAYP